MFYFVLAVCIYFVIWYFIAKEFNKVAEMKGYYYESKYFILTFLFGIVGILLIIALPDRGQTSNTQNPTVEKDATLPKL